MIKQLNYQSRGTVSQGCFKAMLLLALITLVTAMSTENPMASPFTLHPTPTVISNTMRSLFAKDTCIPPCWFGLTPGESKAEDVMNALQSLDNLFYAHIDISPNSTLDPKTGNVVDGAYFFYWRIEAFLRDDTNYNTNYVVIRQGIVDSIAVQMNQMMFLKQTLDILGPPNAITTLGDERTPILVLYYVKIPMVVILASNWDCNINQMETSFNIREVEYYTANYKLTPQPLLENERSVPPETWQSWINGEIRTSCWDAFQQVQVLTATPSPALTPDHLPEERH